jgi:hypothetical protein
MEEKNKLELTQGSKYKIFSLGGKENTLESEGFFEGYLNIGVDEIGLLLKLSENHGDMMNKIRIIPLHVILAIDILDAKPNNKTDDEKEMPHYVG